MKATKITSLLLITFFLTACASHADYGRNKLHKSCVTLHGEGVQCERYDIKRHHS